MGKKYDEKDFSISISDMIMRVLFQWKKIIVFAVIFAILLNCVGVWKDYKNLQSIKAEAALSDEESNELKIAEAEKQILAYKKLLTNRESVEVDQYVNSYQMLNKRYHDLLNYSQNSIRMQVDPNKVPTVELQFLVDTHYQVEYPVIEKTDYTSAVISSLCNQLSSDELCEKIAKEMGTGITSAYVKELIVNSGDEDTFTFLAVADTTEHSKLIADIAKEEMEEAIRELRKTFDNLDITLINESYGELASAQILSDQTTQATNINNVRSAINNLVSGLNDNQKKYYYALLDYNNLKEGSDAEYDTEENTELVNDYVEENTLNYVHVKYILLGFVLGGFLSCGWIILVYLFAGCVRTVDDMTDCYGIEVLGTLAKKNEESKSTKAIRKLFGKDMNFTAEERMNLTVSAIKVMSRKKGLHKIYITSSDHSEYMKECMQTITDKLKDCVETVECGASIIYDMESFEKMVEFDAVVLVEQIDESYYKYIRKEIEKCDVNQVSILGAVVIE